MSIFDPLPRWALGYTKVTEHCGQDLDYRDRVIAASTAEERVELIYEAIPELRPPQETHETDDPTPEEALYQQVFRYHLDWLWQRSAGSEMDTDVYSICHNAAQAAMEQFHQELASQKGTITRWEPGPPEDDVPF